MVPFGTAAMETGEWASGINDARLMSKMLNRPDASFRDDLVIRGLDDGVAAVWEEDASDSGRSGGGATTTVSVEEGYEERMRRNLEECAPWSKAAVSFRTATTLTPMAHNRIVALRREGWRRGFEYLEQAHVGESVCQHCARYILEG